MFSNGLTELILNVIKSWQVLAVTGALILYMYLISYVSRTYHRPHFVSRSKPKPKKEKAPPKEKKGKAEQTEVPIETDSEDEQV